MNDPTEALRRELVELINLASPPEPKWNTQELQRDFIVISFLAPFVRVIRKSDGVKGTMTFIHNPRFYFSFMPE